MGRDRAIELAAGARRVGLAAQLGGGLGLADPGALRVRGPDAASWLHAAVTNVVEGLAPGRGNLSARVDRTGRLQHWFSVHVLAEGELLLILPRPEVQDLLEDLERYLFAEQVTLEDASADFAWVALQGPRSAAAVEAAFGPGGWSEGTEGDSAAVSGGFVLRRSLGGDVGFLILLDDASAIGPLLEAAGTVGLAVVSPAEFSAALEILRIEAGWPRVGPDTAGRKRPLLPELGLEQHTVSYTKGCYLGQEVIARVRTYGSLPRALRALILAEDLELPEPGAEIELEGGGVIGHWLSRSWSVVADAPVALAALGRDVRTPGAVLRLVVGSGIVEATVALLPLHRADDRASQAQGLYERGIRVFAAGDEAGALALFEEVLRLDPSHADTYEAVGVVLGRAGRFHEAIDFFKRLEEIAPAEPMVNTNLSLCYMKLGDRATAEAESARALRKGMAAGSATGGDAARIAQEQVAARRADAERKQQMFSMVLEIDPDDPIALYGLGNALSVLGEWERAEAHYAHACDVQGDNSALWLARGRALEALDRPGDAVEVYRNGMEIASRRGDLMPLKEMEQRVLLLGASPGER
ncbi:MAG TPA: tetratricopeptide repeat protein [Deltaproteobacteria bacterium]|nr:tetratricopeptide repeat protein [Deltaproteobacteria bacterium]